MAFNKKIYIIKEQCQSAIPNKKSQTYVYLNFQALVVRIIFWFIDIFCIKMARAEKKMCPLNTSQVSSLMKNIEQTLLQ